MVTDSAGPRTGSGSLLPHILLNNIVIFTIIKTNTHSTIINRKMECFRVHDIWVDILKGAIL